MSETIDTPVAGSDFEVYVLESSTKHDASLERHAAVLHTPVAGFVDWPVNVLAEDHINFVPFGQDGDAATALGSETISGLVNAGLQISEDFPSFFVEATGPAVTLNHAVTLDHAVAAALHAPLAGSETISGLIQGALARVDEHADTFHFEQHAANASELHDEEFHLGQGTEFDRHDDAGHPTPAPEALEGHHDTGLHANPHVALGTEHLRPADSSDLLLA